MAQRYDIEVEIGSHGEVLPSMQPCEDGEYVRDADYTRAITALMVISRRLLPNDPLQQVIRQVLNR